MSTRILLRTAIRDAVCAGLDVTALAPVTVLSHAELHLGGWPIPTGLASRIRAFGGAYTECRGHETIRFVTLPVLPGWETLAVECFAALGAGYRGIVIFRGIENPESHPKLLGLKADGLTALAAKAWEYMTRMALAKTLYGSGASQYVRAEDVLAVAAEEHARAVSQQRNMIEALRASLGAAEAELARLAALGHAVAVAS